MIVEYVDDCIILSKDASGIDCFLKSLAEVLDMDINLIQI